MIYPAHFRYIVLIVSSLFSTSFQKSQLLFQFSSDLFLEEIENRPSSELIIIETKTFHQLLLKSFSTNGFISISKEREVEIESV